VRVVCSKPIIPTARVKTPATHALYLFGSVDLRTGDGSSAVRLLAQPKLVALLAHLAVPALGRFVRRDTLVGLLWPELDQAHARAALRKAIHAVRATLGADAFAARGDEDVALSAAAVWCDAAAFVAAADSGALARAMELYRGELMPGFHLAGCLEFERWLDDERAAAGERAAAASWALAQLHEREGQLTDAGTLARRAVRLAPLDERALRRALQMLERVGDRAGALRLYEEFARRLRAELDVEPSTETMTLIRELRT